MLASLYISGQHLLPSGAAGGGWHSGQGLPVNPGQVCPPLQTGWAHNCVNNAQIRALPGMGALCERLFLPWGCSSVCSPGHDTGPVCQCSVRAYVLNEGRKDRGGRDPCVRRAGTEALWGSLDVMPTAPRRPGGTVTGQQGTRGGRGGVRRPGLLAETGRPRQAFRLTAPSV